MKHTPTPWHSKWSYIYDEGGFNIADTLSSSDRDLCRDNAAHIVKCVNNHDALVKALTLISHASLEDCIVNIANEALNKAGEL